MLYYARGAATDCLDATTLAAGMHTALMQLEPRQRVLLVPPDFTRVHSCAGPLTELAWEFYGDRVRDILPATGTHSPMSEQQIRRMFGRVPSSLFRGTTGAAASRRWERCPRVSSVTFRKVPSTTIGRPKWPR